MIISKKDKNYIIELKGNLRQIETLDAVLSHNGKLWWKCGKTTTAEDYPADWKAWFVSNSQTAKETGLKKIC